MSEFELARPTVVREDVIGDRRADLVILWSTGARSHIEVKVGDQAFSKTRDTAAKLEAKYPSREWSHYILLPAEDMPAWKAIEHSSSQPIHVITWDDVSACLRRCMVTGTEPLAWRVWAHGFTGLIEQKLLALPPASVRSGALGVMAKRARQISLMRRGLDSV